MVIFGIALVPLYEGMQLRKDGGNFNLFIGILFSFLATFCYSVLYVWIEANLENADSVLILIWQSFCSASLLLLILGVVYFVAPSQFLNSQDSSSSLFDQIKFPALILVAGNCLHAFSWIRLLASGGSTATGLLQPVRSSLTVILSAILFCQIQKSQCINGVKIASTVIVMVFVVLFQREKD
jgi:hypothetical protein